MTTSELTEGRTIWAANLPNWGPEQVEVICTSGLDKVIIRRQSGNSDLAYAPDCHPTQAECIAWGVGFARRMVERYDQLAASYRAALKRLTPPDPESVDIGTLDASDTPTVDREEVRGEAAVATA